MAEAKGTPAKRRLPPAKTPEAQENRMISMAMDLAEKKLQDGTASNQLICHFLKLGSTKEKLEKEMLEKQMRNLDAKTEAIESSKRVEELYSEAISAFRRYNGYEEEEGDGDD